MTTTLANGQVPNVADITRQDIDSAVFEITGLDFSALCGGGENSPQVSNAKALSMVLYRAILGYDLIVVARLHGLRAHSGVLHAQNLAATGLMSPESCSRYQARVARMVKQAADMLGFDIRDLLETFGGRKCIADTAMYAPLDSRYNRPVSSGTVFDRYFRAFVEQKLSEGIPIKKALAVGQATLADWEEYLKAHRPYRRYLSGRFPATYPPEDSEPLCVTLDHDPAGVAKIVGAALGVTPDKILGKRKGKQRVCYARHMVCAILRSQTLMTLHEIGRAVQRDHTTVLHSCNKVSCWQQEKPDLFEIYQRCYAEVQQGEGATA